jgi:hypothetical protein
MNFETSADIGALAELPEDERSSPVTAARLCTRVTASCNSVGSVTCNVRFTGLQDPYSARENPADW